jgi:thiamine phosphate synthase YjbQ (UPF0047 family)
LADAPAIDEWGRFAGHEQGAASILVGIAGVESIKRNAPVNLTDLVPHEGVYYQHDDFEVRTQNMNPDERENGHAHVKAMLLSATSHAIPVVAGEPAFGTWQRLILFEMDEPKDRTITFQVFGG